MNGPQAIDAIRALGLSQAKFARLSRLHPNAITKWANGSQPHGPAVSLLLLLQERPELVAVLESLLHPTPRKGRT